MNTPQSPKSSGGQNRKLRPASLAVSLIICSAFVGSLSAQTSLSTPTSVSNPDTSLGAVIELAPVSVTGSYIARTEIEKVVPITVVDLDTITARGAFLPVDLLTSLPSVVNLPENETRLGSSGARGDNANINLRNLGATGTLILVNGHRMAINPMTAGLSQAVNVNHLPTQGIERIEVLRDGASSIYGSDAVGGVINYILRRDYKGSETTFRFGIPEAGGGQNVQATYSFGDTFAEGRGRVFGTVETLYKDAIFLRDRDFSSTANNTSRVPEPFNALGGAFDNRTPRGDYPSFRIGSATASNYLRLLDGVPTLTNVGPSRTSNPEFYLNLNQFGMASPRMSRGNSYIAGEFDFTENLTGFADFSYYRAESTMVRQPLALNAPTSDQLKVLSIDNPYNPYGSRFYDVDGAPNADGSPRLAGTPSTISLTTLTLPDLGVETVNTTSNVYRFNAGLKGDLGESWKWESSFFYNQVKGNDEAFPDVRESLLQEALSRSDASAYNPFGYTFKVADGKVVVDQLYVNSPEVVDSFSDVFARNAESSILSYDARATGTLFSFWGNEVKGAFGAEYREERLDDVRPPFSGENPADSGLDPLNNDFLLHPPRPDVKGDRSVTSFYAEIVAPIVTAEKDIPLVNTLELTASARHENYSDFGDTTKPKVGINWRPVDWLMVRGSKNEGFMAPSLAALFTSPRWTITAGAGDIDTYRNPVTKEGPYVQRTYFGGNPNLDAAESKGTTYGVVLDVPGVDGLSLTADFWSIERSNLLGQRSVAQIRASDTALLQGYTESQIAAGVAVGQIDLGSGTANYKGDPDVVRFALTAEDIAAYESYNAGNTDNPQAVAGRIFSVNRPFINISSSENEGVDFGVRYKLPELPIGQIVVNSDWSYLSKSRSISAPSNLAPTENDDLGVNGVARWRGASTVSWGNGTWSGSFGAYYTGATQDSGATTSEAVYEALGRPSYIAKHYTGGRYVYRYVMDSTLTFNASVGYRFSSDRNQGGDWLKGVRVRMGINNLTDLEPPVSSDQFGYSPSVNQILIAGRTWTFEMSKAF